MFSQRLFLLATRLVMVLALVGAALACSNEPPEDCKECSLGERRCSAGSDGVLTCKKISATGCHKMVLERCQQGMECSDLDGRPACKAVGSTCGTTCTSGEQRCEGENVAVCRMEPSTGCFQWFVEKTCLPDQPCNTATGDCGGTAGGCQPKNPQATKKCVGNAVHWFDDCDKQGQLIETCPAGKTCQGGQCNGGSGCQPQNLQATKKCVGTDVYWFDDCGQQRDFVQKCAAGQQCQGGQCTGGGGCQPKSLQATKKCVGNAVFWFDDCDKQQSKIQDCAGTQTCQNGACVSTCQNQCQAGQAQCVGNSLQTCDKNPSDNCYSWGQAYPCPSGQVCQAGICVVDPNGPGGPSGRACKVGTSGTCSNDNECCQGQTCQSFLIKGCGPCNSSSDCPKAGLISLSCCKIDLVVIRKNLCALVCP